MVKRKKIEYTYTFPDLGKISQADFNRIFKGGATPKERQKLVKRLRRKQTLQKTPQGKLLSKKLNAKRRPRVINISHDFRYSKK